MQANFPSDSMPGGRFWLVVYPGPVQVDWNIGPASQSAIPRDSLPLLEKESVPFAGPLEVPGGDALRERAQKTLEFFWAMARSR